MAVVDGHHRQRTEPDERERDGAPGSAPDDQEDPGQRERVAALEEQATGEERRTGEGSDGAGQRDERRTVDGGGVTPLGRDQPEESVAREVRRRVGVGTHAVRGDHPSVHRVGPHVVRATGWCDHRHDDEERREREHVPVGQGTVPHPREEQQAEARERHEQRDEPAAGAELPVPGKPPRDAQPQREEQRRRGGAARPPLGAWSGTVRLREERAAERHPGIRRRAA